jgi:ribose-phosphate pyrophosphokinase
MVVVMTLEIQIIHKGKTSETRSFAFPGGELQIRIPDLPHNLIGDVTVIARLQSADALVRLLLTTEVLSRAHRSGRKTLIVPYFPYARQDRVMQPGEAFSLKAVARIINSLGFDEVVVCDPHSDVTPALIENIRVIPQVELVMTHEPLCELLRSGEPIVIIAPDAGAAKKAFAVAQQFVMPLITASKVRDTKTGEITRTEVPATPWLVGHDAVIVDDICDGGRTFIELAKVLRTNGARRVFLYVTHGIFSKGLGVFAGLIDGIYTTDSFLPDAIQDRLPYPPLHISPITF